MKRWTSWFAAAGALTLAAGLAFAPQRAFGNLLLVSFFLVGLGLAGLFFVALGYASGATWAVALRRVPEAMCGVLPFGAAGIAVVLVFGSRIYPWTYGAGHGAGFQHAWLSSLFFTARAAIYLLAWLLFARAIVQASRRQDLDGSPEHTRRNVRLSVVFIIVFALTFWLASYDWIMSLEPRWSSTIFGVYNFAGMFSSGLAALILVVLWQRRQGPLADFVNQEHLHDLGKLLFAFSTFWMYIWFSQYMLIWYANIPEESVYYIRRQHQFWYPLFFVDMVLNWALPFLMLLPKATKRNPRILAKVAVIVLAGRWLDLYLMIQPPVAGARPPFGVWEAGLMLGGVGVFVLAVERALRQAPPVPLKDPHLEESLHYHN